jgi:hypothetical protein
MVKQGTKLVYVMARVKEQRRRDLYTLLIGKGLGAQHFFSAFLTLTEEHAAGKLSKQESAFMEKVYGLARAIKESGRE